MQSHLYASPHLKVVQVAKSIGRWLLVLFAFLAGAIVIPTQYMPYLCCV